LVSITKDICIIWNQHIILPVQLFCNSS